MQKPRSQVCAASRKWPMLEPWCEFLRMTTRLRVTTDSNDELMVTVRLHPRQYWRTLSPDELVLMYREALELLSMLAVADMVSWQELLLFRCGCEGHKFWDDWTLPPRFWLKLGDPKAAGECHDTDYYRVFFCDFDVASPKRAKFRAAAAKIQNAMTSAMRFELSRFTSLPVFVRCIPPRAIKTEENAAYLNGVVNMVKAALMTRDQAIAGVKVSTGSMVRLGRLVLDDIEVQMSRLTLPPGTSRILSEIMKLPVQTAGFYKGLSIGVTSVIWSLPATEFEPILTAMVNHRSPIPRNKENEASSSTNAVYVINRREDRTLEAIYSFTKRWSAVCSSLAVAQHTDEFDMDSVMSGYDFDTKAKRYQWLAYSFLSKESATSVKRLAICDLNFGQRDMSAILSVLNAKNPASKLGGFTRTPRGRAQFEQVLHEAAENVGDDDTEEPVESDDEYNEDEYDGDAIGRLEAQIQNLVNAARIERSNEAAAAHQLELNGDGNGEAGHETHGDQAEVNDAEGDIDELAEAESNDDADDEAESASDQDDETLEELGEENDEELDDDGDGDEDENDDDGEQDRLVDDDGVFHIDRNQFLAIVNATRMFGFPPINPDDFGEDDDPDTDLDDDPGVDDEDPDVRAYYTENLEDTGEQEQEHDDGSVVLTKGTTVRIDQFNREGEGTDCESLVLKEDGEFRVIANDSSSELVNIIVPGFGSCTVERSFVKYFVPIPESKIPSSISLGYHGSIRSLRLSYVTSVNTQIFLPILQYLGVKLTCLELVEDVYVTPESLNQVLAACPHLESFQFSAVNASLQGVLLAAYAKRNCRISNLRIGRVRPGTVDNLIEALQDPTTVMTKTIQKLSLFHDRASLYGKRTLVAIVDMLQHNTVLEFFEIDFYPEEANVFKFRLLEFHGQVLPGVKAQLPLECRLAFLSVLKTSSRSSSKRSDDEPPERKRARLLSGVDLERIDCDVLSLIFRFAAQRKTRRIRVHTPDDDRNHNHILHERYLRELVDSDDDSVSGDSNW